MGGPRAWTHPILHRTSIRPQRGTSGFLQPASVSLMFYAGKQSDGAYLPLPHYGTRIRAFVATWTYHACRPVLAIAYDELLNGSTRELPRAA